MRAAVNNPGMAALQVTGLSLMSTHWMNRIDSLIRPQDDGGMAERVRCHDWSTTVLGPMESWPGNLHGAVAMLLALPMPAMLLEDTLRMQH